MSNSFLKHMLGRNPGRVVRILFAATATAAGGFLANRTLAGD